MERNKIFAEFFTKLLREKEPMTLQYEVAKKLGVQQGTMSKLKNGTMIPSKELAEKIAEVWELDKTEVMNLVYKARNESGAKFFREIQRKEESEETEMKPRLPVKAAAGSLSAYTDGVCKYDCEMLPIIRRFPDYDFTMLIRGNSMEPKYEGGDEIALKRVTILEWGKDYVLDTEDGAIFKKIYEDGDSIRCVSYNTEEYPDFLVPKNMINGYYKFVGLIRV